MESEEKAIQQAIAGDTTEFQLLLLQQRDRLARHLRGTIPADLQHIIDLDDVLQETSLRALRSVLNLNWQGVRVFEAWLNEIARNSLIDLVRAARRRKRGGGMVRQRLSWLGLGQLLNASEGEPHPSTPARQHELAEAFSRALTKLPERERNAIQLYYLEERSTEDAAGELSVTSGAFRALLQRARRRLQALINESDWL